jgi:hypothetical protein
MVLHIGYIDPELEKDLCPSVVLSMNIIRVRHAVSSCPLCVVALQRHDG